MLCRTWQVAATDGLWAGIPWRIHVVFPETYTIKEPSFKLDPAWKVSDTQRE